MKKAMQLGDRPGSIEQASSVRLERASAAERRRLGRWAGVRDAVMLEIDALVLMLLAEAVLLPVSVLALGDMVLIVLYALAMTGGVFVVLLLLLSQLESRTLGLGA